MTLNRLRMLTQPQPVNESRVAHYRKMIRAGKPLPEILVRSKPNGRYSIIDGVERAEACRREGMDGIHACIVDCTDEQEQEIRRKLKEYDCRLN